MARGSEARRREGSSLQRRLARLLEALDDGRASDVMAIDLRALEDSSAIADWMVIASGSSSRHVGALADRVVALWKEMDGSSPATEGFPRCDWVLVDGGDIVLHLFRPEVRAYYDLEGMWAPQGKSPHED